MSKHVTLTVEASDISSDLNSFVVLVFSMGMYTVIYFGTIYVYFAKNPSKHNLVPAAITILYLITTSGTAFQWYGTTWGFIDNGETRSSVFSALYTNPRWVYVAYNASSCVSFATAEGLLIWRCFHVWNRSLRIIFVPLLLIVAEIALFLVEIAFDARYSNLNVSAALAIRIDDVFAAAFFMSFAITLVTTVLIAYRIYSVSKEQGPSSRQLKRIIDIVVQSGAIYASSQLAAAISNILPGSGVLNTRNTAFSEYILLLNLSIAGISSTVMVARVALLSSYPSKFSAYSSSIQFHTRSNHSTVNIEATEITDSADGDGILAGEEQAVQVGEKAQSNVV